MNGTEKRPDLAVMVEEVRWPDERFVNLIGKMIEVLNLDQCDGWEGPGRYILALQKRLVPNHPKDGPGTFVVASPGMSPGFEPGKVKPRIYPVTPETLRQLDVIVPAK
jgi:hypothetical protein